MTSDELDGAGRLDRVEAKLAITDRLYEIAYANDRQDFAAVQASYWPEARIEHGSFNGDVAAFVTFAAGVLAGCHFAAHHLSNVLVEVAGDHALAQSYFVAHQRRATADGGGEEDVFIEGRYVDRLKRRGGAWKIIRRRGFFDHRSVLPAQTPYSAWPAGVHSRMHPHDDYGELLAAFRAETAA
ncbi:nuclear transport factor 2 family protein [Sphingomonas jatrophae]|uniref:SnoaL-like domain-containing protein n=1 Tax=Sphingomonas jatrophae TaxID=1166337 RepID=A0A1I6KCJ2_9SPHN|nr:nuclear transport factor 2 family protein [Sphingomonas jatrophae]SFR88939.1 SnoaL-like domain-containing protein [Sphingomonas jatrophae]